jgi:hypothetical protein
MALTGSVSTTDYQGRYVKLTWTATQNISKNQSTITWTVEGEGTATSTYYNAGPFYVNVAGKKLESTSRIQLKDGTRIKDCEGSTTITHDDEGKASFSISVKAAIYQASYNCSGSKTFTLDTIPRKATITEYPTEFSDEDSPTIKYKNPAGGTLAIGIYKVDGSTAIIPYATATGTSYKFNFTAAQRQTLQNSCKTANSMNVRVYLRTTIGGKNYYHYQTVKLKIINCNPIIVPTATEHQDEDGVKNSAATGSTARWVKGYSDIQYAFNAVLLKGATFKSCKVVCGTKTATNSTSGVIYNIDSKDVVFTYTDSRGNTATKTISGTLVNYAKPVITLKASGVLEGETTAKITLNIKGSYFNGQVKSGVNNSITLQYRQKINTGSWSSWKALSGSYSGGSFNITTPLADSFNYDDTQTFQARVQDNFYLAHGGWIYSGEVSIKIKPVFDWSGDDFTFNVPVAFKGDQWHNLTLEDNFKNYNDVAANAPKVKRCGNVVCVRGIITPKQAFTSDASSLTFASGIPEAWRPAIAQQCVCQGSSMNKWLLSVSTSGTLAISRYGTTTVGTSCPAGAWLPFSFTYII